MGMMEGKLREVEARAGMLEGQLGELKAKYGEIGARGL